MKTRRPTLDIASSIVIILVVPRQVKMDFNTFYPFNILCFFTPHAFILQDMLSNYYVLLLPVQPGMLSDLRWSQD
jgi:hypothetical protein